MHRQREIDPICGELFLAGERVPAGTYRLLGTNLTICLEEEDYLPASLDGRVACYERLCSTWQQLRQHQERSQDAM